MKISLEDIAWKYAPDKIIVSARLEGRNLICDLADKPEKLHRLQPHKKCSHPACWGTCGKCGKAHVHENEHGRFCPNCGAV